MRRVHALLARHAVALPVRLWDGTQLGPDDAGFQLVLQHPWSVRSLLPLDDLSAGEAYVFEDIDVEGSVTAALRVVSRLPGTQDLGWFERIRLVRNVLALPRPPQRASSVRGRVAGRLHSPARDRQAVRFHYDVGNGFYAHLLDADLVYSCAYFEDEAPEDPAEDPRALDRAQVRKLDLVCRKLRLRPGQSLLDIGCGWGSLVLHAARHYGVRALGITLSTRQAELARERITAAGLADRIEIRVEDYRETRGSFDAVASIGMFEHVGEERFETYFAQAYRLTTPGGRFLNHAITTGGRDEIRNLAKERRSFMGTYVFPDGTLAPAHVAVRLMEQAGFELLDVQQLRRHYARTLLHWIHNLETNADAVRAEHGEIPYRVWRAYMAGSVVGFESNTLGLTQVLGVRGEADLPLTRSWMEPRLEQCSGWASTRGGIASRPAGR
ncbi:MAG: cyclopropane-fatty-acyl-phospholipid synthase family protein [Nitriliruptoraceae bacterium]